jgi:hypothetical protein
MNILIILSSPLSYFVASLRPKYLRQHPFLENPHHMSSLSLKDHVLHQYNTTGQIIVLYMLIFILLDNNLEDI